MLVDLHAKSSLSEGVSIDVADVLRRARDAGLDAVAFCEHMSTARAEDVLEAAEDSGVQAFVGVEIPTDKGILCCFSPEIDQFFLNEEWRQATELTTPSANYVAQMFREIGGAVVACRPYDLGIPHNMGDLIFTIEDIHAVEVYNSRVGETQSNFALEAASFMGIPTVGGSDPLDDDEVVGRFATFFDREMKNQKEFVEVLREEEYWAVQLGDHDRKKSTRESNGRDRRGGRRGGGGGGGGGRGRGRRRS